MNFSLDENLKITVEIGGKSLCFLDLKIIVDDKKPLTSVCSKPTYNHLYIDGTLSCLTKSVDGISIVVAKRLKQICSSDSNFLQQFQKYSAYLAARDHKPKEIIRAFEKN